MPFRRSRLGLLLFEFIENLVDEITHPFPSLFHSSELLHYLNNFVFSFSLELFDNSLLAFAIKLSKLLYQSFENGVHASFFD